MLVTLHVVNLGVIEDVTLELSSGMTVLTGETGAGKTLLVGALSLLLGGRADPTMVRSGTAETLVEGVFRHGGPTSVDHEHHDDGDHDGGNADGEEILTRAVSASGVSKAWIDGRRVPLAALARRGADLVELHGQHQHQALRHAGAQRAALDAFGGIDLGALESQRRLVRDLEAEREALGGDASRRQRELAFLSFQIDEIEQAKLGDPSEIERLDAEAAALGEAETIRERAAAAHSLLVDSAGANVTDLLGEAARNLPDVPVLTRLRSRLDGLVAEASDVATELRHVAETWEADPARLEELHRRRRVLVDLTRKYGGTLDEVIRAGEEARRQREELGARQERADAVESDLAAARAALRTNESLVAGARRKAAATLADAIGDSLHELAMPSARFAITVGDDGAGEDVTFLLGANAGEPLAPLTRVASGGELARTMLAVRLALSDAPAVLVFDEVDAGIGGATASTVATKLRALATRSQVIVVTHLAQVAAFGDHHVLVAKAEQRGRTVSSVESLEAEGRVVEISRMLSGHPDSATARLHARELLEARGHTVEVGLAGPVSRGRSAPGPRASR